MERNPSRGLPVLLRVAAISLVALPSLLVMTPAQAAGDPADAVALVIDRSAWSWRHTLPAGPLADAEPSQVPPGSLSVAADIDPSGTPAKATYLHLDLTSLAPTTEVDTLTLTLPVDPAEDGRDAADVRLVACPLKAAFSGGAGLDPATMPAGDCTSPAVGRYDQPANAWTFSLAAYAQGWVEDAATNHGVVIRPPAGHALPAGQPFQINFVGAGQVRAELVGSVPAALPAPKPEPGPLALPPVQMGTVFPGTLPPISGDSLLGRQLPMHVPPAAVALPPGATVVPAAAVRPARVLAPARATTGAFWSLAVLVALLLAGVARVAGNTSGPMAFARLERQRLDRIRLGVPSLAVLGRDPLAAHVPHRRHGRRPISSATSSVT